MSSFLPGVPRPVLPPERYHVPSRLGATRAEQTILADITEGTFRPHDAKDLASIEEAYALFVPFWRVDIERADRAIHLGRLRVAASRSRRSTRAKRARPGWSARAPRSRTR